VNTLEIKGDWNITKGKLKQKWAKFTDNDLRYTEGQQEELVNRIQKRPIHPSNRESACQFVGCKCLTNSLAACASAWPSPGRWLSNRN